MGKGLYQQRIDWTKQVLAGLEPGAKVLDAGAGECKNRAFCPQVHYISQDFCQYEIVEDRFWTPGDGKKGERWDTSRIDIVSDITDIPVENGSFDAIICTEVFEHLFNPMEAVKEFSRIIREGGQLIITAPANCGTHMAPYFYYNGFSEYWYREVLDKNDFEIIEIKENGNYFDVLKERVLSTRVVTKEYNNFKLNILERLCGLIEGMLLNRLSNKAKKIEKYQGGGSEKFICSEYMIIAYKKSKKK